MPTLATIRRRLKRELPRLRDAYGVRSLELFGSWVRGEQTDTSDLDVLVIYETVPNLLRFLALEEELSELLGLPVDLVMKEDLKPRVHETVRREALAV